MAAAAAAAAAYAAEAAAAAAAKIYSKRRMRDLSTESSISLKHEEKSAYVYGKRFVEEINA